MPILFTVPAATRGPGLAVAPTDRLEHTLNDIIYGRCDVLALAALAAIAARPARNAVLDKRLQVVIIDAVGADEFARVAGLYFAFVKIHHCIG